jgi:hypothetical protein
MAEEIKIVKKWYLSKTLWVNIVALAAMIIQANYGFVIAIEEQAAIIVIVNLVLRAITKEGLEL